MADQQGKKTQKQKAPLIVTPRYGQKRPRPIVFGAEMSHPHYLAKIEYQGAAIRQAAQLLPGPGRNAEKLSVIVPIRSRSSSQGVPGELNF